MLPSNPPQSASLPVLLSREQIQKRVAELAAQIAKDYAGDSLLLLGILKGSVIFLADLARAIPIECSFDFLAASSYGRSIHSSGSVHLKKDTDADIADRHVVVVEDVLDTGITLNYICRHLQLRHPRSLRIATLLDKPSRRREPIRADYVGFTIPDKFVVGYGLDYAERFRNLPDICVLDPVPSSSI
jgi:hypoxanthine phosphoribosyltransferase